MIIDEKLDIEEEEELIPVVEYFQKEEIEPLNLSIEESKKEEVLEHINQDFMKTRQIIQDSIDINMDALRTVSDRLERIPNDPRIGEILARLLESIKDLNQQYLNSSKQYIDIFKGILDIKDNKKDDDDKKSSINIQNAAIFMGTMKDLIKSIPQSPI